MKATMYQVPIKTITDDDDVQLIAKRCPDAQLVHLDEDDEIYGIDFSDQTGSLFLSLDQCRNLAAALRTEDVADRCRARSDRSTTISIAGFQIRIVMVDA